MNPKAKALNTAKAPTPFQVIGSAAKTAGKDIAKGAKKVGSFLDQQFVEPSRNVNRIQDAKMRAMDAQAKSGAFNRY